MALVIPHPPDDVAGEFAAALPGFLGGEDGGGAIHEGYAGSPPQIPTWEEVSASGPLVHDPQQVFVLGLGAAMHRDIDAAGPAGWRLFAGNRQYKTVLGRMTRRRDLPGWKLAALHYGDPGAGRDRVWELLEASNQIPELPEIRSADYELRVLAVPALNLEAFWLHALSTSYAGLVAPFPAAPNQPVPELNTARVYSMHEFLTKIAPLAERRNQSHPKSGS